MNADLTISTLAFKLAFSDKTGSERRETSRGVNLPEVMSIKSQPYTDSATKVSGIRTVLRFDRYVEGTDGKPVAVTGYYVSAVPSDPAITSADVLAVIARINGVLDATSPNLDLGEEIFVNKEQ